MRFSLIIVLIACIGFVIACEKSDTLKKAEDPHTSSGLKVKLNDCVTTIVAGNSVKLCFDSLISDSRCPSDGVCIWQGTATCKFSFHLNNDIHILKLSTVKAGFFIKDTTISGYKIEFLNLDPYPRTTSLPVPASKYKAEVKITKP